MKTILDILKKAGGWHPGLYVKIENSPFMALVIEAMDESGPMGLPALSVCHYGEQNGDLMRDPEMGFELGLFGGAHLMPFYYRNDYAGVEQWSRLIQGTNYAHHTELHKQHEKFAKLWDRNLRQQGFVEVFERQGKHRPSVSIRHGAETDTGRPPRQPLTLTHAHRRAPCRMYGPPPDCKQDR